MTDQTMEITKEEVETTGDVERVRPRRTFVPRVDIYEVDEGVVLLADMPGVAESDINIMLEKNVLKIRGEVELETTEEAELNYREYHVGDYERTFALSEEVDRTKIEATLKNGVLRLWLPKAEEAKTRKIAVKTA